jgi:hypothetical protein
LLFIDVLELSWVDGSTKVVYDCGLEQSVFLQKYRMMVRCWNHVEVELASGALLRSILHFYTDKETKCESSAILGRPDHVGALLGYSEPL